MSHSLAMLQITKNMVEDLPIFCYLQINCVETRDPRVKLGAKLLGLDISNRSDFTEEEIVRINRRVRFLSRPEQIEKRLREELIERIKVLLTSE